MTGELYLQGAASCHSFIRIQGGAELFAKEFADSLFDGGDSGGTANNLHCIDIFFFQLWIQEAGDKNYAQQLVKSYCFTLCSLCWQ